MAAGLLISAVEEVDSIAAGLVYVRYPLPAEEEGVGSVAVGLECVRQPVLAGEEGDNRIEEEVRIPQTSCVELGEEDTAGSFGRYLELLNCIVGQVEGRMNQGGPVEGIAADVKMDPVVVGIAD